MNLSNRDEIDLTAPVVREFRVKSVRRYIVTDWADYRGGNVRELAECANLEQANEIADTFGAAHPGALVNKMEQRPEYACELYLSTELLAMVDAKLAAHGIDGGILALIGD